MTVMTLYGSGGCGINMVSKFSNYQQGTEEGFAGINTVFLDTSRSNLTDKLNSDSIYIFDGLDGSGKKRDTNYATISERSKELLQRFKPTDFNVVIHSGSGGTGSVIGPVLVSELLNRNAPTVVVIIGGSDSRIEAENTTKTLQSYELIASKRELPVVAIYHENSRDIPRGQVDQRIQTTIVLLAAFFSNKNKELDFSDLRNFLNYQNVTSFKPRLSLLDFFSKKIELSNDHTLVSVVTLTDESNSSVVDVPVEYQAVGFISEKMKESIKVDLPIHAGVINGGFTSVIKKLSGKINEIDIARKSVIEKSIVPNDVISTIEGIIL